VPVKVLLDSGSSTLAIYARPYNRDNDTTAMNSQLLQSGNFGGAEFLAAVVRTQVGLLVDAGPAAVTLAGANLGVIYKIKPGLFGDANGILGLGYKALNPAITMPADTWRAGYTPEQARKLGQPAGTLPTYLDQLVAGEQVTDLFAFSVGRSIASAADPSLNAGVFVLGGGETCTDLYTGDFQTAAVVHETYYNTNLVAVQVGAKTIQVDPAPPEGPAPSNSFIDSGNGGLMLDPALFPRVIELFDDFHRGFGALLASDQNQTTLDLAAWPALRFVLQGPDGTRATVTVAPKDYWQFDRGALGNATAALSSGGAPNPGQSILGLPLFSGHYVVFDRSGGPGKSVIKFAARREPGTAPLVA
jgi:hypothetical protein